MLYYKDRLAHDPLGRLVWRPVRMHSVAPRRVVGPRTIARRATGSMGPLAAIRPTCRGSVTTTNPETVTDVMTHNI